MSEPLPDEVRRLLDIRADARTAGDFDRADQLRDQLADLGWQVQDGPAGSTARPALPASPVRTGYARAEDLASLLDEPPIVDASLQLVAEDHPDDLARCLRGLSDHAQSGSWELVLVANGPTFDLDAVLVGAPLPTPAIVLPTSARLGWADAHNLGLRRSRGAVTVLLDTSLEPTGDVIGPLLRAFEDPSVGIAGGWGVTSGTGRQFVDAPPGEVDAVEGYCLAIRREALRAVEAFDHRYRFYRNADLDFSFAVRAAAWRAIRTEPLPLLRHEHRAFASLPPEERDRLSKRNFYRFLKRWGDRRDLLLRPDA
ncbi:MAG: glycosyltransferase [Candidatus Limnocylindria bacterium]